MNLQLLKVSTRMLLDLIKVFDTEEKDFEIGCRCKDEAAAEGLETQLLLFVSNIPEVEVKVKEDKLTVSLLPKHFITLLDG